MASGNQSMLKKAGNAISSFGKVYLALFGLTSSKPRNPEGRNPHIDEWTAKMIAALSC